MASNTKSSAGFQGGTITNLPSQDDVSRAQGTCFMIDARSTEKPAKRATPGAIRQHALAQALGNAARGLAQDMFPAVSTEDNGVWPADDGELVVSVRSGGAIAGN
jgi:hypothetical protein